LAAPPDRSAQTFFGNPPAHNVYLIMDQILKVLKIYFDSCCYGRPQDDQTQPTIEAETIAIGGIINICRIAGYSIIGSTAVLDEILANPNDETREADEELFTNTITHFIDTWDAQRAQDLHTQGLSVGDSGHLAAAEAAGVAVLVTVDQDFERIATSRKLSIVRVINPLTFLGEAII
jgi:predicted nucleic acid-binding protein